MKNLLFVTLALLSIVSCEKEDNRLILTSADKVWAPYSEGRILTYANGDEEIEAEVIEVVTTAYLHTNVIRLGEIGSLHIEVYSDENYRKIRQFYSIGDFVSEPFQAFNFKTDIEHEEDNPLGILPSLTSIHLCGQTIYNVKVSRLGMENGNMETYLTRDRGLIGFNDVHDTGQWKLK